MPGRTPPRYVPTLTDVVQAHPQAVAVPASDPAAEPSPEQLIQRVMQRIDLSLERRLREAIAIAVIEQTRSIAPLLRKEIEAVVRQTVTQAFEEEIAARPRQ
jgi:hypothetical protein